MSSHYAPAIVAVRRGVAIGACDGAIRPGPIVIVVVGDGVADAEIVVVGGARSGDGLTAALPDRVHRFISRFPTGHAIDLILRNLFAGVRSRLPSGAGHG